MTLILVYCAQALPVFLHGLEAGTQRELLHSGVRQYLHRMIICLGDELLKYIPMIVLLLLKDSKVGHWLYVVIYRFLIQRYIINVTSASGCNANSSVLTGIIWTSKPSFTYIIVPVTGVYMWLYCNYNTDLYLYTLQYSFPFA